MEDRWAIETTGPGEQGAYTTYLIRSWSGCPIVAIRYHYQPGPEGEEEDGRGDGEAGRGAEVTEITWEEDTEIFHPVDKASETEMKEMARGICRGILGVEFPAEL